MIPFRFLHAADLHLDSPFRGIADLPAIVRDRIKESTFLALDRLVRIALQERVDFVVISGDVYDLEDRSLRAQVRFQRAVERLAERGVQVFVIHGNHDPENGARAHLSWPEQVVFFGSDGVSMVPAVNRQGRTLAHVYGISYAASAVTDNLARGFTLQEKQSRGREGIYNIGLLHTNVDGDPGHDNYAPCTKQELIRAGIDYWALGHIHSRRVLHDNPLIVYPGNLQGRNIKETDAKGCFVVDVSDGGGTSLTFHAVDDLRWFKEDVDIQGLESEQQLKDRIEQRMDGLLRSSEGRPCIVRFTLTGRSPLYRSIQHSGLLQELQAEWRDRQRELAEQGEEGFIWIESIEDRSGPLVDLALLENQEGFLGEMLRQTTRLLKDERLLEEFFRKAVKPISGNPRIARYLHTTGETEWKQWLEAAREIAVEAFADRKGWGE
ncbi:metallophosphoesterase family protein [Ferviditalea candida]|uniref:DNA repair exonuclease n=1 Tax=Ferviditalea candida TaxID=3108399 RepID=A0ABU5ZCG4_9BACL|nr:DNA repair exonuclease [Paenibacillaceae bacterium T2]